MQPLTFFDIPSTKGHVSWSPNTAKVRMTLNYKRIPFKTTWLSFPDIESNHKSLGIPANPVGPAAYTCPAICDPNNVNSDMVVMQDSFPIVKYLDATYTGPAHPSVFDQVGGAEGGGGGMAISLLVQNILNTRLYPHIIKITIPKVPTLLDDRGVEYFHRTRTARFGVPLSELCVDPEAEWRALEKEIRVLSDVLVASQERGGGPFFMGSVPCYGDFCFVGFLVWIKAADERDGERVFAMGQGGCFQRLVDACKPWLV
ncbi:hypothetical protein BDR26DRAFT_861757 [Obelidium mucronatum]|nr:hypothetical protein BDR26DRAFT_861757 [Obelidium mucronatum]